MTPWETQFEEYGAVVPDWPRDKPCYEVNPPLWAFWRKIEPSTKEHPILTEQEIVRRLDMLYFGDGTCNTG